MDINVREENGVTVATLAGELNWTTAPLAEQRLLELASPEARLCLDMGGVTHMTSAGLRMLLVVYRTVSGQGGRVVLVNLLPEIETTMDVTGFLGFFNHFDEFFEKGVANLVS